MATKCMWLFGQFSIRVCPCPPQPTIPVRTGRIFRAFHKRAPAGGNVATALIKFRRPISLCCSVSISSSYSLFSIKHHFRRLKTELRRRCQSEMRISSPAILPVGIKAKTSNDNASISVLLTYNSEPSGPGTVNPK